MPFTGFSPYEPGGGATFDPVGNSLSWSDYFALSPGGRFPGDLAMFLEGVAAQDPGPGREGAGPNPDYEVPDWLQNLPGGFGRVLSRLFSAHESNVRNYGEAPVRNPLESGPAYFPWSGPGARFGPPGGELHGLLDQGGDRLQDRDDAGPASSSDAPPPRSGSGGGGGFNFQFQSPQGGLQFTPQFVGWNPTAPFAAGGTLTPGPSSLRGVAPPAQAPPRQGGGGGGAPRGAGGGRGGGPRPGPGGGGPGGRPAAAQVPTGPAARAPGQPMTREEIVALFFGGPPRPGAQFREGGNRGYDVGMLDKGSPGWMRDPTTGVLNTAGFPSPTPSSPLVGESADEWIARLHDQGFDNESIIGLLSGWGTGPVMRDPNTGELVFANQATTWVGPDAGPRGQTPIYFQGRSPEQLDEDDRRNAPSREMWDFLRGGGGGSGVRDLFSFGTTPVGVTGMRY